jgi:HPt (histidine-containing phosphotransfer) domain-containing protein
MQGDREHYLAIGMDDYISKPVRLQELIRALTDSRPLIVARGAAGPGIGDLVDGPAVDDEIAPTVEPEAPAPVTPEPSGTVDLTMLREYQALMGDEGAQMVVELVTLYLQEAAVLLQQTRQALDAGDTVSLRHATHTLKGSSSQVGAMQLADTCGELEALAREGSVQGADVLLVELQRRFAAAAAELRAAVTNTSTG